MQKWLVSTIDKYGREKEAEYKLKNMGLGELKQLLKKEYNETFTYAKNLIPVGERGKIPE